MQTKHRWLKFTSFKLLIVLLCLVLLGQGVLVKPALAEKAAAPNLLSVTPYSTNQLPTVVSWSSPQKSFVFIQGNDHNIWQRSINGNLTWNSWLSLGTPYHSGYFPYIHISAVSWTPGRVDLFVTDGHDVYRKFLIYTTWSASWEYLGHIESYGKLRVVSWGAGRLDLFANAPGDLIYHKSWSSGNGGWEQGQTEWELLPYTGGSVASVTSWASGRLDFVMLGNAGLLHGYWDYNTGWAPGPSWENLGTRPSPIDGSNIPFIIAARGLNKLDIFAIDSAYKVVRKSWASGGGWSGWENLGGNMSENVWGDVTGVSWARDRIDLFEVRGGSPPTGGVFHKYYSSGTWYPSTTGWEYIGGEQALKNIAVTSMGTNRLDLFATRTDGAIWHLAWDGAAWRPSINSWECVNC